MSGIPRSARTEVSKDERPYGSSRYQPQQSVLSRFAERFVLTYQRRVSPRLGTSCRFQPTCSNYGLHAFRKYGFSKAVFRTAWRILRCNPWNKGPTRDCP